MTKPRGPSGAPPLRTAVFWAHLAAGVVVGTVILIMSATGVLLAYERQILEWAATRHAVAPPSPGAARLPLDTLLARARAAVGDRQIVSLGLRADAGAPVAAGFENRQSVFLDPYTGSIVGDDAGPRAFFAGVQRWHRRLAIGATPRSPLGQGITGASNLAFLFLILSGLYLWWPRQLSARAFRAVMLFGRGARGRARDWNWHHVLGFWSAPALVLIVGSAAFISYAWPGELTQRAFGERPTARPGERESGQRHAAAPLPVRASLDAIRAEAALREPAWRTMQLRFPRAPSRPVNVIVSTGGATPDARSQGEFDAKTGAVAEWQTYADGTPYQRFRSWIRPIHTGEAGGVIGQTIAALVSAAAAVLVWTGFALAWRRLRSAVGRRAAKAPELRQAA